MCPTSYTEFDRKSIGHFKKNSTSERILLIPACFAFIMLPNEQFNLLNTFFENSWADPVVGTYLT